MQGWGAGGSEKCGSAGAAGAGLKWPPQPVIHSLPFFQSFSLWLINCLRNCDWRSYSENGKDKAVKRHLRNHSFILSVYCVMHSDEMWAEGTERIKFAFLSVQTVAIVVVHFLLCALLSRAQSSELKQSWWISITAGRTVFISLVWEFCHGWTCLSLLHDPLHSLPSARKGSFLLTRWNDPDKVEWPFHRCQTHLNPGEQPANVSTSAVALHSRATQVLQGGF